MSVAQHMTVRVKVRYAAGAYVATLDGYRASSTESAPTAVDRVVEKLLTGSGSSLRQIGPPRRTGSGNTAAAVELWEITLGADAEARCIGCGCTDADARAGGCHWLRVDYTMGLGVCSQCQPYVEAWDGADGFGPKAMNLVAHLRRQREFSRRTFGPGERTQGVIDHIRKELIEIEAAPRDLGEWVDVILLALDGAWRAGHDPVEIALAIATKQIRNEGRTWPDWRTAEPGKAIEHVREAAK